MIRFGQLIILSGLILLALAGVLLALGRNPDNLVIIFQAEVLAEFAYGCFVLGMLVRLVSLSHSKKRKKTA